MTTANEEARHNAVEAVVSHIENGGTLGTAIHIGGDELEAIYAVGYNHMNAHKYNKAIALFKFLCLYDHTTSRWYYSLGVAQQYKKDYAAALTAFAMATMLDMEDPGPQLQAGYCLMALERWKEAHSALEGAVMTCGRDERHAGTLRQANALLSSLPAVQEEGAGGGKP